MPQEDFFWIALPNGLAQGRARVSALLVPRLIPDAEPATVEGFAFEHWPETLAAARFQCRVGAVAIDARRADQPLDAEAFRLLFPRQTPVRSPLAERALGVYNSYPAAAIAEHAREMQAESAPQPRGLRRSPRAAAQHLASSLAALRTRRSDARMTLALRLFEEGTDKAAVAEELTALALARDRGDEPVPVVPRDDSLGNAYLQFQMFHQPLPGTDVAAAGVGTGGGAIPRPMLDVAQRVASLSEYPQLLRRLGLLVDLDVDPDRLPSEGALAVVMVGAAAIKPAPVTRYRKDATSFVAAVRDGTVLTSGFINLLDGHYALADFDVDAAASNIVRQQSAGDELLELRSVGLSVLQDGRAAGWLGATNRLQEELAKRDRGEAPVLFAEDVVRGFRVDVQEGRDWRSLHQRKGRYLFNGQFRFEEIDEGMVVPALTQRRRTASAAAAAAHDGAAPDYLAEALFLWNGWSLSAPRPGTPMEEVSPLQQTGMPLQVEFVPGDGSLPRLRFGNGYRVRLRAADLAGNGLKLQEANAATQIPVLPAASPWRCLRYESVPPPRFRDGITEVVLRAGVDAAAEQVLAPPVVSQLIAEQSRKFDAAFGAGAQPARVYAIAAAESLPDPFAAALAIVNCPGVRPGMLARFQANRLVEEPLGLGEAFVPAATSVLLLDLDHSQWPRVPEFRLRLVGGDGAPSLAGNVLTVSLPPAAVSEVQVSSCVAAGAVDLMAALSLALERLRRDVDEGVLDDAEFEAHVAQMRRAAQLGVLSSVTPAKTLRLVHAVQQPLAPPNVTRFDVPERLAGRTVAWLGMRVEYDTRSTARLEVVARWTEAESDVRQSAVPLTFEAGPAGLLDARAFGVSRGDEGVTDELQAAKRALIKLNRFTTGMPELAQLFGAARLLPVHAHLDERIAAARAAESAANGLISIPGGTPDEPPSDLEMDKAAMDARDAAAKLRETASSWKASVGGQLPKGQEFGDTRHRAVEYSVRAVSRFADYFPGGDVTLESAVQPAIVKSAAAPPAPRVTRIVPTFAWSRSTAGGFTSQRRTGLRVYLEGPWYESGAGEMLAVVLELSKGATQWGADPLFVTPSVGSQPGRSHFTNAAFVSGGMVTEPIVAYRVERDDVHGYFCDVDLAAAKGYMPFVQLGLARFQPNALPGLELSEPVTMAPVQLMPMRTLSAVRESPASVRVEVRGVAPSGQPGTRFGARVQTKLPGAVDDAGWMSEAPLTMEPLPLGFGVLWAVRLPCVAGADRRLLIEEVEELPDVAFDGTVRGGERLVYAEVVPI